MMTDLSSNRIGGEENKPRFWTRAILSPLLDRSFRCRLPLAARRRMISSSHALVDRSSCEPRKTLASPTLPHVFANTALLLH